MRLSLGRADAAGRKVERSMEVWGAEVTVVVHHVPETEDFEGEFEAVTRTLLIGL